MNKTTAKSTLRLKRKKRVRAKVYGTEERPRLSVFRSASHVYVQVIDDNSGKTLASLHSYNKAQKVRANVEACAVLGEKLAEVCKSKSITKVVFDKNGYAYHGRIKALAEGARKGGLSF